MNTAQFISSPISKTISATSFTWRTPSNIALVKYWGKYGAQLPKNPSISFTLNACFTLTTLEIVKLEKKEKEVSFEIFFEGKKEPSFKPKIASFFKKIEAYVPFIFDYKFVIKSRNSFPHSSGIASSASGMSALALCIMSLEKALNPAISKTYFNRKASFLARLGSGSASRSIEGPVVLWGKYKKIAGSSDVYAIPLPNKIHENFKNYHDTILLVDKGQKQVSSTVGHDLMHAHPYAANRFEQAFENVEILSKILETGNLKAFINLVEHEALTLHAMMMTSNPYFILMKPNTLQIINKIWDYRAATNSNICFTLDAGANVHVLYPEKEKEKTIAFIQDNLLVYCENNQYICDRLGLGAKPMSVK